MKRIMQLIIFFIVLCSHSIFVYADDNVADTTNVTNKQEINTLSNDNPTKEITPLQWLQKMQLAQNTENYEISFINVNANDIKSLRYRHLSFGTHSYAQMITLEGSQQEIIRRNDLVGYFQPNFQSFSLKSSHIVDYLPSILWANLDNLNNEYDFVNIGLNRVADRLVQTFKILPKDNFRYQYVVFIDTDSHLLLRSDILDRDGNLLEQYLVVNLVLTKNIEPLARYFSEVKFPPLLVEANKPKEIFNWSPSWLPKGFKLINQKTEMIDGTKVETQMYSDGIFSFSLNISDHFIPNEQEKGWRQGILTLYTMNNNNRELTFTGQLPIPSAKRILEDIQFK